MSNQFVLLHEKGPVGDMETSIEIPVHKTTSCPIHRMDGRLAWTFRQRGSAPLPPACAPPPPHPAWRDRRGKRGRPDGYANEVARTQRPARLTRVGKPPPPPRTGVRWVVARHAAYTGAAGDTLPAHAPARASLASGSGGCNMGAGRRERGGGAEASVHVQDIHRWWRSGSHGGGVPPPLRHLVDTPSGGRGGRCGRRRQHCLA